MAQSNPQSSRGNDGNRSASAEARKVEQVDGKQDTANERSLGTSYLEHGVTERAGVRWREIQSNFVDDPRRAVAEARGLVGELIDDIVRRFETERNELEQRWSSGEDVSTEDLRRGLQRYRDFFGRLLAKLDDRT